ncbi:MAG: hypothetical protein WEB52_04745 [Dehalococcoidia bacterium]
MRVPSLRRTRAVLRPLDHGVLGCRRAAWRRLDTEIGESWPEPLAWGTPHELANTRFWTGGEAWLRCASGEADAKKFGVFGTTNFGPAEISGNAIRDLAALNKVETLPWDEWGRLPEAYRGETGDEYDRLIDRIAEVTGSDNLTAIRELYEGIDELRVPESLLPR